MPCGILDGFWALRRRYPHDAWLEKLDVLTERMADHAAVLNNQALDRLQANQGNDAAATIDQSVKIYERLVKIDPETYSVDLTEGLINLGLIAAKTGAPAAAASPLTTAAAIASKYDREDLLDAANRNLRYATALDPTGVAATLQQANDLPPRTNLGYPGRRDPR